MKTKAPTESYEQRCFVSWFYKQYPGEKLAKFCNEGIRSGQKAHQMRLEGLLPGMPDVFIAVGNKCHHGLLVEFKRVSGGVVSAVQCEVIDYLNSRGYKAVVCRGWKEAAKLTEKYMQERG